MKNKIRFAVVGCGCIGHRHVAMIEANPEMELCAVADVRPAEACRPPAGVPFFGSLEDMMESVGDLDVVSVCTPNGYHADMAVSILRRGVSVLMEKPMALSVEDALRVRAAEEASRGRVFCVFQNRYTPASQWLKTEIVGRALGALRSVQVSCLWNRDDRYYVDGGWHGTGDLDGGTLFTQFSHFVDVLLWLVGPVDVEAAAGADFAHARLTDFEDTGAFLFRVRRGGAIGTFAYSTAVPGENYESVITLVGDKGCVKVGGQYMSDVIDCKIDNYEMPPLPPSNPPNDYGPYKGSAANHGFVFANLADVLLRGAEPTATWQDGFSVVETICRIYDAMGGDFRSPDKLEYRP